MKGEDVFLLEEDRKEEEDRFGFLLFSKGKEYRVESFLGRPKILSEARRNRRNHTYGENGYGFKLGRRQIMKRLLKQKELGSMLDDDCYSFLESFGGMVYHYCVYLSDNGDSGTDVDKDMERIPEADFFLCRVLLVLLLREEHFCQNSFLERFRAGTVTAILDRMLVLLEDPDIDISERGIQKRLECGKLFPTRV